VRALAAPKLYQRAPGGFWQCYWRGERWSTGETDKAKAAAKVRQHYDPRHTTAREKTIEDAIALVYEALVRRGRTAATKENAAGKLGHFARIWEGRSLATIDYPAVADYVTQRTSEGVKRITISHELGYLRQAWKLARANGWVTKAWDELMPERFDTGHRPRTRWLTKQELSAVLGSLPPDRAAWVAWIVATGSDVSDVERAKAGDVDWKRGLVRVRGTKTVFRDRLVPITPLTRPLLKLATEHGPPFVDVWNTPTSANIVLRKLAARIGIPHFSPKDLRRTWATWHRHAGVDLDLLGRGLGHADGSPLAATTYGAGEDDELARLVRMQVRRSANGVRMARNRRGSTGTTGIGTRRK